MKKVKKWSDVYPQGTQEGNEEQAVFLSLECDGKWDWKSTEQISAETELTCKRVEEIISKYLPKQIILQCPTDPSKWGYWERHKDCLKNVPKSIAKADQLKRMANLLYKGED